jgi:hypothetical protein
MMSTIVNIANTVFLTLSLQACETPKLVINPAVPNPYKVKAENVDPPKLAKLLTGAEQTTLNGCESNFNNWQRNFSR